MVGLSFSKAAFPHHSITAMTSSFPLPEKGNKLRLKEQGGWLPFPDFSGNPLAKPGFWASLKAGGAQFQQEI